MATHDDQAAGLRAWAAEQGKPEAGQETGNKRQTTAKAATTTAEKSIQAEALLQKDLLVLTHPSLTNTHQHAYAALVRYHEQGWKWVGSPEQWQIRTCVPTDPNFSKLAENIPRWALWIDADLQSFQRAYRTLRDLRATGISMPRMLLMHPPLVSRRGLINNVQQMARDFFQVELLVLQR